MSLIAFVMVRRVASAFSSPVPSRTLSNRHQMLSTVRDAIDEGLLVQDMLARVRAINQLPDEIRATALDFTVDNVKLGKVRAR